jgi:hypothetical protein
MAIYGWWTCSTSSRCKTTRSTSPRYNGVNSPSTSPRYNGAVRLFSFLPTQEPIEDLWSTPQRPSTMPPPEQIMAESEHRDEMHRGLCCVSGWARRDYCLFPGPWRWAVPFTPFSFLFLFFFCFFIIYIYMSRYVALLLGVNLTFFPNPC